MSLRNLYRKVIPTKIRKRIFRYVNAHLLYLLKKKSNNVVMFGPFKGMKLDLDSIPLASLPFSLLAGTFELEIHPAFVKLFAFQFNQIINLGSSEGYYAIGAALKWPQAIIYAFETEEHIYREKILKLARDNSVSKRVNICGRCTPADLAHLLTPDKSTLLILDVEGDEINLLDPAAIYELRQTTVLVELHDIFVPGCSGIIEERFGNTHDISKYITRPRTINDFPLRDWNFINPLMRPFIVEMMRERNETQEYFLMIPKEKIRKP